MVGRRAILKMFETMRPWKSFGGTLEKLKLNATLKCSALRAICFLMFSLLFTGDDRANFTDHLVHLRRPPSSSPLSTVCYSYHPPPFPLLSTATVK